MITKKRLLVAVASDIADAINIDNYKAMRAAEAALKSLGLHVISPLLDAVDFDSRPAFREITMNDVRDLLAEESEIPSLDDPKQDMRVRDA